jgi:hypothetical protein
MFPRHSPRLLLPLLAVCLTLAAPGRAQVAQEPYRPLVGQAGKDVVWVPTPPDLVETMLDMAKVTSNDYVIDLGSGDGITVIAAARRGATALGIEYNPDLVELSKRRALAAGVGNRTTFVKADIFESDFSKATVITMYLLKSLNLKLRPTLLGLTPGTRIVSHTFDMDDWAPDAKHDQPDCERSCAAFLWVVPARVQGTWRLAGQELRLVQKFQMFSGALGPSAIAEGKLRGGEIAFRVNQTRYTGRVDGSTMSGTMSGGNGGTWTATRR